MKTMKPDGFPNSWDFDVVGLTPGYKPSSLLTLIEDFSQTR